MTYDILKDIGGFMRRASMLRCNINYGVAETIEEAYNIEDGKEAVKNFSLLKDEDKFLLIWKIVNIALIEEPVKRIGYLGDCAEHCSYNDAFSLREAKILFKGIAEEIGGDDGAYALCALILFYWLD